MDSNTIKKKRISEVTIYQRLFITSINSTSLCFLSYLIFYSVYTLSTIIVASLFHIDFRLQNFDIKWLTPDNSVLWTENSITAIFGIGPLLCILAAPLMGRILHVKKKLNAKWKLFYAWCLLHSVNFFLGGFIAGDLTKKGLGFAVWWIFVDTNIIHIISVFIALIIIVIGVFLKIYFIEASYTYFLIQKKQLLRFLLFQVIFPLLLLIVIINIFSRSPYSYNGINLFTLLLFAIPMLFEGLGFFIFEIASYYPEIILKDGDSFKNLKFDFITPAIIVTVLILFKIFAFLVN